jgi:hypothetical protein
MPSSIGQRDKDEPDRFHRRSVRTNAPGRVRQQPRLEVLEMRCLMSGWGRSDDHPDMPAHGSAAVSKATVAAVHETRTHDLSAARAVHVVRATAQVAKNGDDESYPPAGMPALLGRPEVQPGWYVTLGSSSAPHHTAATAQPLPELPFFGVVGTISTSPAIDYYRLTLNERAGQLNFGLFFENPGAANAMELQVWSGTGQLLGEWSSSAGASIVLSQFGPQAPGSTLYLAVSAVGNGTSSAPSADFGYQLWVSIQIPSLAAATGADSTPNAPVPLAALSSGPLAQTAASGGAAPIAGSAAASTATATGAVGGSPVAAATGPPTLITGRTSIDALVRRQSDHVAGVDLDLAPNGGRDARNLAQTGLHLAGENDSGARAARGADDALLAAIDGPGGLTLMEAVAIGHRRKSRNPSPTPDELLACVSPSGPSMELAPTPGSGVDLLAVASNPDPADGHTPEKGTWRGLTPSIFSALGVATVFTLNAALSQPLAGFDLAASRFAGKVGKLKPRDLRIRARHRS